MTAALSTLGLSGPDTEVAVEDDVRRPRADRPPSKAHPVFLCGLILAPCFTAMAWIDPRARAPLFLEIVLLASVTYLLVVWLVNTSRHPASGFWLCIALAVAMRLPLLFAPPLLSDDVYRYIWDGRIQTRGYNPYVSAPADPALQHLHNELTRRTEHPTLPTIYPPVAEVVFGGIAQLSDSILAFKLLETACDVLIMLLLLRWLEATKRDRWLVLVYAWSPLVALEGAGSGHVDLLGVAFLMTAALALARKNRLIGTVSLALAVGVKFLPIVLVPLLWRRIRWRDAVVAAAVLAGFYALFFSPGSGVPTGSLAVYAQKWRFNGPVFAWLEPVFSNLQPQLATQLRPLFGTRAPMVASNAIFGVPVLAGLIVAAVARRTSIASPAAWAWPMAAALFCLPAIYPWYLLWLTPFLIGALTTPLAIWTVSALSTYSVWEMLRSGGQWVLPAWVLPVEYGPVAAAMFVLSALAFWQAVRHLREGTRPASPAERPVLENTPLAGPTIRS